MSTWTGHLATLGQATPEGLVLVRPERLRARPLPLPVAWSGGHPVGSITRVFIHGDQLRAEGTIRNNLLAPGERLPIAIELDDLHADPLHADTLTYYRWRLAGASVHPFLNPDSGFPGAHIRLKEPQ